MRAFSLLVALVGAQYVATLGECLPTDIDPGLNDAEGVLMPQCEYDLITDDDGNQLGSGWATFDADKYTDGAISLTIEEKEPHTDAFRENHSGTVSALSDKTNGRYILACKQTAGNKTVSFVVHRPSTYTRFGAEWVKLFPKDSWANVTNEYEPFTFSKYGAKVPLLRAHNDAGNEDPLADGPTAVEFDNITVYMEVKDIGDYEIMYGNPAFTTTVTDYTVDPPVSKKGWVAIQFKKTLLRVGSPWAECPEKGDDTDKLPTDSYDIGTIVPALFGHPNLNLERYKALAGELKDADVTVKVVLELFNSDTDEYTMSETGVEKTTYGVGKTEHPKGEYTKCYVAGNACPEGHSVCKSKFCELDTWEAIIKLFKAGGVEVLGAVGADTTSGQYDILGDDFKVDGFFFMQEGTVESPKLANSVYALGEPLLKTADKDAVDTFVTLSDSKIGIWNPYSWYPHEDPTKWAAIMDEVDSGDMQKRVDTLFDRGYGYVFLTDEVGFNTSSSYNTELLTAIKEKKGRRLQARELSTVTYEWSCDDTGFQCSPVCLAQDGPVTTIASKTKCAGAPLDPCECKCYYDAAWVCSNGEVVCQATKGIETMIVGDLLCENRGTPKPSFEALSNQRQAGECERRPTTRGQFPIQQCLTQWATTTPAPEKVEEVEVDTVEESTVAPAAEKPQELTLEVTASFAVAASMLALTQ
jgi:hypothetical protein